MAGTASDWVRIARAQNRDVVRLRRMGIPTKGSAAAERRNTAMSIARERAGAKGITKANSGKGKSSTFGS